MKNRIEIGFWGLLALIFITLKLTGYIHWSWIWVLGPIWIPVFMTVVVMIIVLFLVALCK